MGSANTFRYRLHRNDGADQTLQIRLGYVGRLISRSPSAGLPYEILEETASTAMSDDLFPLPLRELEDPLLCEAYVVQLLSFLNLGCVTCKAIARKITSSVVQMAAENYDEKFQLVVDIDYIQMFWKVEEQRSRSNNNVGRSGGVMVEEKVVLEKAIIETQKKLEELGDQCSVCCDELKGSGKMVARIPCGHMYHKSCILTWLQRSNSCPLCRTKIQQI